MSSITAPTLAAIALYLCAALYQALRGPGESAPAQPRVPMAAGALALVLHGLAAGSLVFSGAGVNLSLWPVSVLIFFVVNLLVLASSLRKPLHSLLLILFPASALGLGLALVFNPTIPHNQHLSLEIGVHVLLSILAYSLLTIAAVQSLLLGYQHYQLKHHHPGGFLRGMPPLQTMEVLLFEVIWTGFALLTLSLVSGFLFLEDFWAQHLAHKTFFSLVGWMLFAVLLWGRHALGWRGKVAIRWTLGGFASLALAYWGSKFVLEILLGL